MERPASNGNKTMSPPHIPKIGATTVPAAASARSGGHGAGTRQAKPEAQAATQAVERAVVVNRSLELLETMAGQVSEATGESIDAARSSSASDGDASYRVELMGFIVGSLSRAAQAFRQKAAQVQPEEPELPEEEVEEEAQVEAALPEAPVDDPVEAAAEPAEPAPPVEPQVSGYGSKGQAVQDAPQEGSVKRWA
jgi:hypothetical protein